jgi:predicted DNA-binding protein YlxM (UPF0122 family)
VLLTTKHINPAELEDKYKSGLSQMKLADVYDVSQQSVHYFMVKHSIPRRLSNMAKHRIIQGGVQVQ